MDLHSEVLPVVSVAYLKNPGVPSMVRDSAIGTVGNFFDAGCGSGF
jgi:hypothetical protein